jgi:hypothetical protein
MEWRLILFIFDRIGALDPGTNADRDHWRALLLLAQAVLQVQRKARMPMSSASKLWSSTFLRAVTVVTARLAACRSVVPARVTSELEHSGR